MPDALSFCPFCCVWGLWVVNCWLKFDGILYFGTMLNGFASFFFVTNLREYWMFLLHGGEVRAFLFFFFTIIGRIFYYIGTLGVVYLHTKLVTGQWNDVGDVFKYTLNVSTQFANPLKKL